MSRDRTLWRAWRDGWRLRSLWACFVTKRHRPCRGCTPPCELCAWCGSPVGAGGAS